MSFKKKKNSAYEDNLAVRTQWLHLMITCNCSPILMCAFHCSPDSTGVLCSHPAVDLQPLADVNRNSSWPSLRGGHCHELLWTLLNKFFLFGDLDWTNDISSCNTQLFWRIIWTDSHEGDVWFEDSRQKSASRLPVWILETDRDMRPGQRHLVHMATEFCVQMTLFLGWDLKVHHLWTIQDSD